MALLLALVVSLIPLAIAPGAFFYFDVTPKIVLLLLGVAAAALWAAAAGISPASFKPAREARWFLGAICGMALSLIVSTLLSVNPALSAGGSTWRYWGLVTQLAALLFACLVAACCAGRPERWGLVLRAAAVAGCSAAAYGIAQYFGWDPLQDARGYHVGEGVWMIVRPPSTLGHADYFANWLLFPAFASAALAWTDPTAMWRWLARASVSLSVIAIVLSGTRAALLGLFAGAVFLAAWRGLRPTRRLFGIAGLILAAAAAFYLSPAGARLRARVHWVQRDPAGGARFLLWRDTLRMASQKPVFGYGPETYIGSFARYQSADLSRAYPDFYHESPHNIYLDALAAQGLPGPLLLLSLGAIGLAAAWRARRNPAAGALGAGLAAMTLSQQFTCFMLPTALAYYVTIALVVAIATAIPSPPLPRARRWPAWAVAIPCAAVLGFFAIRLWIAESTLAAVRQDLDVNRVSDAAARYQEYEGWHWPGSSADLWYSRRLAQIAGSHADRVVRIEAFQQAGQAALRAVNTSEAPFNAYYNLAAFYARRNDFANTEECLRKSISTAPNWFKTHWMLAQVLQAAARMPEAELEAAAAASLDGGKHAEVSATLAQIRSAPRPVSEPVQK